ncbi:kinase-like protein, partial [Fomitiporia mediterranea MF3/22]|uniref:kinase-like protein n=1 Tax=Fomitiporia mediterranea (strain MF3/22) TaxID=694068 RepID=UPI0004408EB7
SLVSPWMPNGTAARYLARQTVSERIRVLTGVADGLSFLHRHGVVHGDLKGENVMIDMNFEPRIADFGLSKLLDEVSTNLTKTATGDALGSIRWTAPELFLTPGVNKWSDIWSFGMTMLELFTNAPPYRDLTTDAQVIIMVHKGERPQRPSPRFGMDDDIWNLCCKCWSSNPELRPSTRVIAKQL